MTARPIPFSHAGDDLRTVGFDKKAWQAGLIAIECDAMHGVRAVITWNAALDAYVVDSGDEQVSRWIGYRIGTRDGLEVVWHGTFAVGRRWVAQFIVVDKTLEAA